MNWMQQYRQRVIEQERQSEPTPQPKAVSVTVEASERERQSEPTPAPKAASTDRDEVSKRKQKDTKIRCNRCEGCTPHTVHPCNYPEYAVEWIVYVCDKCGSTAYARG